MPESLGRKHVCISCGIKFYDLNRSEPACPRCGGLASDAPRTRSGRRTGKRTKKGVRAAAAGPKPSEPEADDGECKREDEEIAENVDQADEADEAEEEH